MLSRMWKPAPALRVSRDDREWLEALVRSGKTPQRVALRAHLILRAAAGRSNHALAKELGISRPTVLLWRQRYIAAGVAGLLKDAPRPGRKKRIGPAQVEAIVNATLQTTPPDATHWSVRTLAKRQRVGPATLHRIWQAHNLQPHRVETFKLSRDPEFVRKLRDIVGLYLNPPAHALVLSVDEKSQIQALDRTQPILPLRPGGPARQTHDYERHGTTTLFAALNILEGHVIERCRAPPTASSSPSWSCSIGKRRVGRPSTSLSTTTARTSIPWSSCGAPLIRAFTSTSPRRELPG